LFSFGNEVKGQTTVTYDFAASGAVTGLNEDAPGIALDANIGFGSFKNSGTSNPGIFSSQLRLYQNATKGGSIKIYANNGVTITKVVINASGTTGPAGYTVDGGSQTNMNASTTYTIDGITATTEVEFFQRDSNSSNRIYVDSFEVTYTLASVLPTVTTAPATSVTQTAAILGGNITNAGSPAPTVRGIEYSTVDGFLPGDGFTVSSTGTFGTGAFTESVTVLAPGTTYYFRAFATNSVGTARGDQESFTTSATATAPSVITNAASSVTNVGVTLNGEVVADGGEPVTARGFVYSDTQTTPLITDGISTNQASGSGVGVFDATVSGLTPNTRY
jgi:hypothetical protein